MYDTKTVSVKSLRVFANDSSVKQSPGLCDWCQTHITVVRWGEEYNVVIIVMLACSAPHTHPNQRCSFIGLLVLGFRRGSVAPGECESVSEDSRGFCGFISPFGLGAASRRQAQIYPLPRHVRHTSVRIHATRHTLVPSRLYRTPRAGGGVLWRLGFSSRLIPCPYSCPVCVCVSQCARVCGVFLFVIVCVRGVASRSGKQPFAPSAP